MDKGLISRATVSVSRHPIGAETLAVNAVSELTRRQPLNTNGLRQFILDHLVRAVSFPSSFDASAMLDEMRGNRVTVDAVIDTYVPAAARVLGKRWIADELDFASVTIGSMRLQSLLSCASDEALDFTRPFQQAQHMLIVIPHGEQHTLGAFVLAAQLRRFGCRVEMSFCEPPEDLAARVIAERPDKILLSCARPAALELASQSVQNIRRVLRDAPPMILGGAVLDDPETMETISGVDLVTNKAKEAVAFESCATSGTSDQAWK